MMSATARAGGGRAPNANGLTYSFNSEDAAGKKDRRLGSPKILPSVPTPSAPVPLRPCGRPVGTGRQAIGNLFGTLLRSSLCLSSVLLPSRKPDSFRTRLHDRTRYVIAAVTIRDVRIVVAQMNSRSYRIQGFSLCFIGLSPPPVRLAF